MKPAGLISLAVIATAVLSGCEKKAEGQVAAVVNGEEITLQEVNAELGNTQAANDAQKEEARKAALQRVIQRRLLAQEARKEGLDKDVDFLIRRRALEDSLLVMALSNKLGSTIRVPETTKIEQFIKDQPFMFGDRSTLNLDVVQFDMPTDPNKLQGLKDAHSMEQVMAVLRAQSIQFNRAPAKWDSAQINPALLRQVNALPAGEPFIMSQNGKVIAAVVSSVEKAPATGDNAKPLAANAIRQGELNKLIGDRLKSATEKATIEYQTGFAPPKPAAAGAKPAAGTPATPAAK